MTVRDYTRIALVEAQGVGLDNLEAKMNLVLADFQANEPGAKVQKVDWRSDLLGDPDEAYSRLQGIVTYTVTLPVPEPEPDPALEADQIRRQILGEQAMTRILSDVGRMVRMREAGKRGEGFNYGDFWKLVDHIAEDYLEMATNVGDPDPLGGSPPRSRKGGMMPVCSVCQAERETVRLGKCDQCWDDFANGRKVPSSLAGTVIKLDDRTYVDGATFQGVVQGANDAIQKFAQQLGGMGSAGQDALKLFAQAAAKFGPSPQVLQTLEQELKKQEAKRVEAERRAKMDPAEAYIEGTYIDGNARWNKTNVVHHAAKAKPGPTQTVARWDPNHPRNRSAIAPVLDYHYMDVDPDGFLVVDQMGSTERLAFAPDRIESKQGPGGTTYVGHYSIPGSILSRDLTEDQARRSYQKMADLTAQAEKKAQEQGAIVGVDGLTGDGRLLVHRRGAHGEIIDRLEPIKLEPSPGDWNLTAVYDLGGGVTHRETWSPRHVDGWSNYSRIQRQAKELDQEKVAASNQGDDEQVPIPVRVEDDGSVLMESPVNGARWYTRPPEHEVRRIRKQLQEADPDQDAEPVVLEIPRKKAN